MNKASKKLINNANDCVDESLKGFTLLYPGLKLHSQFRFISKVEDEVSSNVALLSGGGSGHEPFSAGYVGKGMLSGSVSGNVFASPPKSNIIYAIRYLSAFYKGGVVVIIPNYTGDCLNFGMAIEHAKSEDIHVASVSFGEDCASGHNSVTGKRGMCGIVFAYKICGALANSGSDLNCIMNSLNKLQCNMATLGISVRPCSLPGQGPLFIIAENEMELGTGVHGEAGIEKIKFTTAKHAVEIVMEKLCGTLELPSRSSVVVMVNNLGATSQLEQNILCYEVYQQLGKRQIVVERMYSGLCFTSLEMAGFQVSILNLPKESREMWLQCLDADTDSPAWTGSVRTIPIENFVQKAVDVKLQSNKKKTSIYKLSFEQQQLFKKCLEAASCKIIELEQKLNDLDSGCGDGDCGTTLKNLSQGVMASIASMDFSSPERALEQLSEIAENKMGGTSGAIYSLCFTGMIQYFTESKENSLFVAWIKALDEGVKTVILYSRATLGDRTIIDAVKPAVDVMRTMLCKDNIENAILKIGLSAAVEGCERTKDMRARAGRASYVSTKYLTDVDAGAFGFVSIFEAVVSILITCR